MALRDQCEKAGMTLTELAKLTSIPLTALSKVEHGRRRLTLHEGSRIAKVLGCVPDDLIMPLDPDTPLPAESTAHGD